MLQKLLEIKLAQAVQDQTRAGVGNVPKDDADELLTKVAQFDASKLRGLIVIAAFDLNDPQRGPGIDVQTLVAGTPATLDPLLELASFQIDEKLQNPDMMVKGEICPGCGEIHDDLDNGLEELLRRGPGRPRGGNQSGGLDWLMDLLTKGRVR